MFDRWGAGRGNTETSSALGRALRPGSGERTAGLIWRCMLWCMDRTNIYLQRRQTERLDRLAVQEGISRAELIRRLLDRSLLDVEDSLGGDLAAIDASFGCLRDAKVPDRAPGGREAHLARMWQKT